jgi:hypothetical protein
MPNWQCPKCGTENKPEGIYCKACGQKSPGLQEPATPAGTPSSKSQSILDEIRSGTKSSFKQSRSSLDQFTAGLPKLSDLDVALPDLDSILGGGGEPLGHGPAHDLQIKVTALPRLNYALAHCGQPLIPALEIQNASYEDAKDVLIKAWLATDYGEPWQKTIPVIPARKGHVEPNIVIPLTKSRLQEVREAEKANLRIDVVSEGTPFSETCSLEVLAYNEWYYHPRIAGLMACFVQPNTDAVEKIISLTRDRMKKEFKETSLDGYQSGDPKKVVQMLEALYLTLQKDLQLTYINPPPSFEGGVDLPDGTFTLSQKVFFPEQIFKHRRGTCLDLALLCAACVERMGLNPVCFLIRGHAFFGAWLQEVALQEPVVKDHADIEIYVAKGLLYPLNSTTFAVTPARKFSDCRDEALYCLSDPKRFMCAVDVASCRMHGFKPIPPMVSDES